MALGGALIAAGVAGWWRFPRLPHLVVAGVTVHACGIALLIAAARTIWFLNRIDYAAPVVSIQRQLGGLRAWYVRCGVWLGQAWWFPVRG